LEKEIEYLKNYINLQLLRFGDTIRFTLFVSGNLEGYKIEPMLLIPFVENAFKHGTQTIEEPILEVVIMVDNKLNTLNLMVINNKSPEQEKKDNESGIGLSNVLRRLQLLYPGSHSVIVEEKDNLYTVNLEINL
jgi:LytS/YehU family sensor histidine kinase